MKYQHYYTRKYATSYPHSFDADDLAHFGEIVGGGEGTFAMEDAIEGDLPVPCAVLRHDVDHNLDHAIEFATWEADNGFRSSYYLLHTAWYWVDDVKSMLAGARRLQELGHEVGLHQDAVAEAYRLGHREAMDGSAVPFALAPAADLVRVALDTLRQGGIKVSGTATHGTPLWYDPAIKLTNSLLWSGGYTAADFDLLYEDAYHIHQRQNAQYISDNHGKWTAPLALSDTKQTHILTHPGHWYLSCPFHVPEPQVARRPPRAVVLPRPRALRQPKVPKVLRKPQSLRKIKE